MRERDDGHRTESCRGRVSAVPTFQLRCRDANPPGSTIPTGQPPLGLSDQAIPLWRRRPPSTSGYPGAECCETGASVRTNGTPQRLVSFYRLSAVCQPRVEKVVAGAGFEPPRTGRWSQLLEKYIRSNHQIHLNHPDHTRIPHAAGTTLVRSGRAHALSSTSEKVSTPLAA
jgi:hypothetical protein